MITSDQDFGKLKGKDNIFIYGAKRIANVVYEQLGNNGCQVSGFIVSRTLGNPDSVKNLPVHLVYDLADRKEEITIVVAVLSRYRREVVELLLQLGFCNLITLSDKYANALTNMLDEKQLYSFLDATEYELEVPAGIENNHAILRRRGDPGSMKWRVSMSTLSQCRQAAGSGAWQNDGLAREFEQVYGKPGLAQNTRLPAGQAAEIQKKANIYAVRCHVDKQITGAHSYAYLQEIQAGAALTEQALCDIRDNTGDNISDKNRDFSECSAIYWVWKNAPEKEDTGLLHYRRHLDISEGELLRLMEEGTDLLNTIPCLMYPSNMYFFVSKFIYEYDWLLMMKCIREQKPEYYLTARQFEKGHFYHANNIFIMRTEWFDKMCDFVFPVLLEIDRHYTERNFEREDRYAGYPVEALYSIFIMHHAKEMRIAYADMLFLN